MKGLIIALVVLLISGCTAGVTVKTTRVATETVSGNFDLILFGDNYLDDPETIAFADLKTDNISFEPYAPEYKFRRYRDITAKEMLHIARVHLIGNSISRRIEIREIVAPGGKLLGYEVRALYWPLKYGFSDVPEVSYSLSNNKLLIYIRIPENLENDEYQFKRRIW